MIRLFLLLACPTGVVGVYFLVAWGMTFSPQAPTPLKILSYPLFWELFVFLLAYAA